MNKYVNGHHVKNDGKYLVIDNRWQIEYDSPAQAAKEFVRIITPTDIENAITKAKEQEMNGYLYAVEGDTELFEYALKEANIDFKKKIIDVYEVRISPKDMFFLYSKISGMTRIHKMTEMMTIGDMYGYR